MNVPLPVSSGDSEFEAALQKQILPALNSYGPQLLLVSAGFDAHRADPLAGLSFTGKAYAQAARSLSDAAEAHSEGRLVSMLEGGYSPEGNLDAITHYINELSNA